MYEKCVFYHCSRYLTFMFRGCATENAINLSQQFTVDFCNWTFYNVKCCHNVKQKRKIHVI